jgi:hypothetical protein
MRCCVSVLKRLRAFGIGHLGHKAIYVPTSARGTTVLVILSNYWVILFTERMS